MVSLAALSDLKLADPEDEFIPEGSIPLAFLRDSIQIGFYVDPEEYQLGRFRAHFSSTRWRRDLLSGANPCRRAGKIEKWKV